MIPAASGSAVGQRRPRRNWTLSLVLLLAALLHAATFLGVDQNAFVLLSAVHHFYFKHSYAAGMLPLAVAGLLLLVVLLLLLKRLAWAQAPAFLAVIASLAVLPRLGNLSPLAGYAHPIQLVPWFALALTWGGCLWLFASARRRAST